jgi:hypothetical protein
MKIGRSSMKTKLKKRGEEFKRILDRENFVVFKRFYGVEWKTNEFGTYLALDLEGMFDEEKGKIKGKRKKKRKKKNSVREKEDKVMKRKKRRSLRGRERGGGTKEAKEEIPRNGRGGVNQIYDYGILPPINDKRNGFFGKVQKERLEV